MKSSEVRPDVTPGNPTAIRSGGPKRLVFLAVLLVAMAAVPRVLLLDHTFMPNGIDEGIDIHSGRMVERGARIYDEVNTVQAPLMIKAYGALDVHPISFRALAVLCSLAIIAMAMWSAYRMKGGWAMMGAGIFASMDLLFLQKSRLANLDIFCLFWTIISITLFMEHRAGRGRPFLAMSGMAIGLGVMTKLFAVVAGGAMFMLLAASTLPSEGRPFELLRRISPGGGEGKVGFIDLAIFSAPAALVIGSVMLWFGPSNVIEGVFLNQLHRPSDPIWTRSGYILLFLLMNIVAVPFAVRHFPSLYRSVGGAIGLIGAVHILFFLAMGKVWLHHLIFLTPFLAIAGGYGLARSLERNGARRDRAALVGLKPRARNRVIALVLAMSIVQAGGSIIIATLGWPLDNEVPDLVRELTGPEDHIIVGDPMVAVLADRPVPPGVVNVAFVQYPVLTDDVLNRTAVDYAVTVIVLTYRLLHMEGFRSFVEGNYTLVGEFRADDPLLNEDYTLRLVYRLPEDSPLHSHPDWGCAINGDEGFQRG